MVFRESLVPNKVGSCSQLSRLRSPASNRPLREKIQSFATIVQNLKEIQETFKNIKLGGKSMAPKQDEVSASGVESKIIEDHAIWLQAIERSRSNINILQDRCVNVEESALLSNQVSHMEFELLWSRLKTATTLLTYLKSKATALASADLAQLSLDHLEGDTYCLPQSRFFESIATDPQAELRIDTCRKQGSIDGTYVTEMLKHVETVMDSLARRAIFAESEAAILKGKVLLSQEEIQRKVGQINNMSLKLEDMEKFALGTTSILGEMRQRVDDLVQETSRQKQRATENEQELSRVRRDFESLKSYVTSLISVRETLVSSEKQFQTIERLFERLVAKSTQLEGEKVQKEAEVQKLMEENTRLTALVDKKEAQLLAMNEQCKMMALSSI